MPVCKQSEESPQSYLESDTVWINPHKPTGCYPDNSHLYINKICPPEYSELEGRASYRNLNHCTPQHQPGQQGQYYASSNIMDQLTHSLHSTKPASEVSGGEKSGGLQPGDSSSCSSRHSESYKLSGSGSRSDSGSSGAAAEHARSYGARVTDPGLPPPVPPLRGPSSYGAGARHHHGSAASFNSFGHGAAGVAGPPYCDNIYGYGPPSRARGPGSYIYGAPVPPTHNNHYETASIYQANCGPGPRYEPQHPQGEQNLIHEMGIVQFFPISC